MSLKPSVRAILPMTLASGLILVIAIGSAWYISNLQRSSARMLSEHLTSMRAAQELEYSVRELRTQGVRFLITANPKHLESIPRLQERIMVALANAESVAFTPAEQALTQRIRDGLKTFFAEYETMTKGNPKQAEHYQTLELIDSTLATGVIEPTQEYLRLNEGMLVRAAADNQATSSRITTALVTLGLCGAVGGMMVGWVLAVAHRRSTLQTDARLRDTARQLDVAARSAEHAAERSGRAVDALDDVADSAAAVLKRLERTEREALRAEQLAWVGQMAAGIAHEIRNPLMSIKLLVQTAASERAGDRLRPRDVAILEEEIVRLETIIHSFLDFARPPRPVKSNLEMNTLLDELAATLSSQSGAREITLDVEYGEGELTIEADANQVRQVLYNLVINAMDAQPGGGHIRIMAYQDFEAAAVVVQVEDHGPGLPKELGEQIFDPFVSTKESGMGLGLSICRRIVEDHGGTIVAENMRDDGARFKTWWPKPRTNLLTPRRLVRPENALA